MSGPIEIGLQQIYDKLCVLEDKTEDRHLEVAVKQAELNLRVKTLEDDKVSKRAVYGAYISSAITLVMGVIAILVKV